MPGSLACKKTDMVSQPTKMMVKREDPHSAGGVAAQGGAGRRRAVVAALDGSGDRKKGQSRENECASEDHCDVGDEWEGECASAVGV